MWRRLLIAGILADAHPLDATRSRRSYSNLRLYREARQCAAARRVALSIYEGVGFLAKFPNQDRSGRTPHTRELVITGLPYIVVYRLRGDDVEIVRILHGAQQWP